MNIVEIKENLINAAIRNSYSITSVENIKEEDLRIFLHQALETILGYNNNIELKKKRLNKFQVPNSQLEDYDQRIIDCSIKKILMKHIILSMKINMKCFIKVI